MHQGSKKYREMQCQLDKIGTATAIVKEGDTYSFYTNYQLIKTFKKRDSCNKRIVKLFKNI